MSTDTITGAYAGGFIMSKLFTTLYVTDTGSVGGTGVLIQTTGTVINQGKIAGGTSMGDYNGISLSAGGSVVNGTDATISGRTGILSGPNQHSATITNYGKIEGTGAVSTGVRMNYGGSLFNAGLISGGDYGIFLTPTDDATSPLGSVTNRGTILSGGFGDEVGVVIYGDVTNGGVGFTKALISGFNGVDINHGSVANFGSIVGGVKPDQGIGVDLGMDSSLTNGSAGDHTALVSGYMGVYAGIGYGSVANFGTIIGFSADGVYLFGASPQSNLVNGSTADTTALIQGYAGITTGYNAGAPIRNFGTIEGTGAGAGGVGIVFTHAGAVVNGSAGDKAALISGYSGITGGAAAVTVTNFGKVVGSSAAGIGLSAGGRVVNSGGVYGGTDGLYVGGAAGTITNSGFFFGDVVGVELEAGGSIANTGLIDGGTSAQGEYGVVFADGGRLTNGSATAAGGNIVAYGGVWVKAGVGAILNFADITSTNMDGAGVSLYSGALTNGSVADTKGTISGGVGVFTVKTATVVNFGEIRGSRFGAYLLGGGRVINGSASDRTAELRGDTALYATGAATVTNYGTIQGYLSGAEGVGLVGSGSRITNGSAGDATALIQGVAGVVLAGGDTLTNFGTVQGLGGNAVSLIAATARLVVEAGSTFEGAVVGDGGTLVLASGTGTIGGHTGGALVISGSMPTTTFSGFGLVDISAGATFADTAGLSVDSGAALDAAGTLKVSGGLTAAGAVEGTGLLALSGGTSTFVAGLTIAKVTLAGAATVASIQTKSLAYAGVWTQSAGTATVGAVDKLYFTGAGDSFSGEIAGAGTIDFAKGSDTLKALTLSVARAYIGAATVTLSGAITNNSAISVTSPSVVIAAAGATLSGTGTIALSNLVTNKIAGVASTATLTNVSNKITGAGQLGAGEMTMVNEAAGLIDGNQSMALTIDTGMANITNAGIIENQGTGGTIIKSAVNNTGTLLARAGTLTVNGAVTGAGTVGIAAGTADFVSTFTENVAFAGGATGTLELNKSTTYTGSISGFSKTGTNLLDLADIAFSATKTKATFSGTTTSGVLTVTDGTQTAKIKLTGNYLSSTFVPTSDGHGGTLIHDPAKASTVVAHPTPSPPPPGSPAPAPLVSFAAAMAAFGPGGAGSASTLPLSTAAPSTLLASAHG